jgi:glutamate dehydrogenase/leucine dehydrogenase
MMTDTFRAVTLLHLDPKEIADRLGAEGGHGSVFVSPSTGEIRASAAWLEPLAEFLRTDERDYHEHEGVFLSVGASTGALLGAFVHRTIRGAGAGGLRHWPYPDFEAFVRDGLRLALGMSRKNALAGLWWGGGKGIIARQSGDAWKDPAYRRAVYREYGAFVSSLRGLYVTAEDVGTTPPDMAEVFSTSRFVTCVPPAVGGSGNPSPATAQGVVCAMEGALDFLDQGTLGGKKVAMQGAGNVATFMIEELLERGVGRVVATEINPDRQAMLSDRFAGRPVEIRLVPAGDDSIFAEPCDVLAPNALGGVLNPDTIPRITASIICGAANNQLLDDRRDDAALAEQGVVYVPDFVANRMGIVNCANEQYGSIPDDPAVQRHLGREWENSVFRVTQRVLERAKAEGVTTSTAANRLADEAILQPHPIWGHRGRDIVAGLEKDCL